MSGPEYITTIDQRVTYKLLEDFQGDWKPHGVLLTNLAGKGTGMTGKRLTSALIDLIRMGLAESGILDGKLCYRWTGGKPAAPPPVTDPVKILAAEQERHTLLTQAAAGHERVIAAEMRRYREELDHIGDVYQLRLGELS